MTLKLCPECHGLGSVEVRKWDPKFSVEDVFLKKCPRCKGKGIVDE
jgi:DnaJ-class molecular chaperone